MTGIDFVQLEQVRYRPPAPICRRAALTVCAHATDVDDAQLLLEACGLIGYPGMDSYDERWSRRPVWRPGLLDGAR